MNDQNSSGSFFSGLLIGAIAGSVVALLTAPQSGEKTRQIISDKTDEFQQKAADTIDEALAQAERAMSSARETTQRTIDKTQKRISELEAKGQKMAAEQRDRLNRLSELMRENQNTY